MGTVTGSEESEALRQSSECALVLVVDDDPNLRKTLSDILRSQDYLVESAGDGSGALAIVEEAKPTLAVIDLRLPDMNGLALLEEIKRRSPITECIVLTGHASQDSAIDAINKGAYSYLIKPYDVDQLLVTIRRAVERGELDRQLRRNEKYYRDLINHLQEQVVVIDRDYRITDVNQTFLEFIGKQFDEIAGRPCHEVWHGFDEPCDLHGQDCALKDVFETGEVRRVVHAHLREDGAENVSEVLLGPLLDDNGEVTHVIESIRDITKQKQLEERLRHSEKMESVGQLAGGVAHDLNNILQAIYGHTDAGLDLACGHGERVEALKAVRTAAEKAAALIGQLLAFSRRQVIDYKIIDLNALINNLLKMLRRVIGEHVDLRFAPCHDPAVIIADPGQVEQVLMNLCVNARDSMPSGGTITIETCPNGGDDVFDADQDRPAEGWRMFSVTDTGSGMNKEVRSKAFEPFFTTKEMGRGTGLGLATVHGIIKQHDGLIELDSEPGRGTQFRVYLPGSSQRPEGVKTREKRPSRGGAETILVAEDDDAIREIAQNVLESVGYTVYVAADGQEAVDVFKAHADEISLALLDAVMPKLGGHEVRTQIRALRPDVRILYNSGYDPDVYPDLFRVDQSVRILQKPYDLDTLLQAVRGLLDE